MSQRNRPTTDTAPLAFLAGGGEMGERTRAFDWSVTPVGPASGWPQSLKTVVRIMLDSRYAMWLGWGPEFTFFYNDAYARMTLGPKHPWALGRPAREVWSEIWGDIGPRAESVIRTGQATWDEGLLLFLERQGFPEETYHTFSYSPVPDDQGVVGGILCVVTEETARTIGERRLRTLRELAARTTDVPKSVEEACRDAARTLAGNCRDIPFVLLYLLDAGGRRLTLAGSAGLDSDTPLGPVEVELLGGGSPWPFRQVARTGKAVVVHDVPTTWGPLPGGAWPEPSRHAVVLPMARPGQAQLAGFVVAGVSPRLPLDDGYRGFLDLLAGQVATAVANAQAYEEERRRAESLADLDRAKTVFFSNVSHEFRTPLTLMLGPVEDLLASGESDLSPAARDQLEVVNRNGLRLMRLVNSLLDFSRIEAGRARAVFQPTDLAAYTAELASVFRSAVERAGLNLRVDCPRLAEPVFVDREMWEKVVLNLLSNAFKFTFEGAIDVTIRQVGPAAELRVRDTGTGIPAEAMPRLFERFHRVESAPGRNHEGSGIGLALVQELIKLHGGTVAAESVFGQGTTFIVRVPMGSAHLRADQIGEARASLPAGVGAAPYVEEALRWLPGPAEEETEESPESPTDGDSPSTSDRQAVADTRDDRPRIVLADDNADMRQYVSRLLAQDYRVDAVPDGEAALSRIRQQLPDLIVTDVMMPRLDGFGLVRELRADPRTRELPVIMLSARAGEESRVVGMEAGVDDYLVKPFSARELLARVRAHLQMARFRREANETLRLQIAKTNRLVESNIIGVIFADEERITEANDAFLAMVGYPRAELEAGGLPWRAMTPTEHAATDERALEELRQRGTCAPFQKEYIRKDGSRIPILLAAASIDPSAPNWVCFVQDMSRIKAVEQELRDTDRRKDEFLATLAHELRNPLAPLRNGLQVMKLAKGDPAAVEQARAMMERQLGQMVRLIDDLLDVSRISRGKVELRPDRLELAAVIQNAVETSRPLIESSGHDLTIELSSEPIHVDADLTRLAQVFSNLLNNAAKYTEKGGRVWLTVSRQGGDAVVSVRDSGVGIPADMLPRVFDMFTQVDRELDKSQGGLGIGLSLVKGLVEMHGGSVEVKSDGDRKGSEFIVRLPAVAPPSHEAKPPALDVTPVPPLARRRILVADDNMDSATSLAKLLKIMGNEVCTVNDGMAAVEAAATFRPEVVLLDIGMPELNGYDACRRIREQPWGKFMVLVALTGWGQQDDKRRSQEAGFDHHLVKPVDPDALETLLAGLQPARA